jgi:hypothetical protein
VSTSPDGHWLLFGTSQWVLVLFDWTTGAIETANASAFGARYCEWRPGHDELWFHTLSGGFSIWKPGSNVITVNAPTSDYTRLPEATDSVFTRDGRHWFAWNVTEGTAISVGSADDPTAPTVPANPHPTATTSHWETPDGRLLVEAWAFDPNRKDMYLVDPDTGASRVICGGCRTVALGQTRALMLLDWELSQGSGDLALVDLITLERTLLGESVYAVAVDRGKSAEVAAGTDALAPGTQVAFLVRNRLASPYDGLWVAALP